MMNIAVDGDHDVATDDSKLGEDSLKLVDELKSENDEQKDIDELKTSGDKEDVHIEEGDAKNEDGELSVDVHRESKCLLFGNN
jgi:hypothetical protein